MSEFIITLACCISSYVLIGLIFALGVHTFRKHYVPTSEFRRINPLEDVGYTVSRNLIFLNPAVLYDILKNDPFFDPDIYEMKDQLNREDIELLTKQAMRLLLRQSVVGTNLPASLAYLRRCLLILTEAKRERQMKQGRLHKY
uniref:Uncharacterized protein n=1 Tax=Trichobilharzia regenti TaxID=157069 RepID=A0AA85KA53_TRIRE|nr:unnamed protein product [Trichobilharzia regenti]